MHPSTNDLIRALQRSESVACIAHVSPDADALGSLLGFTFALRKQGKKCYPVIADAIPAYLSFIPGADQVLPSLDAEVDTVITLDCADRIRVGYASEWLDAAPVSICIDHHASNPGFCDINWIDGNAGSTSEMVVVLLQAMKWEITPEIAACLYTGILSDSGRFLYDSTSPQQHRIVADLMETGMDWKSIHRSLYQSVAFGDFRLELLVLGRAEFSVSKTIVSSYVSIEDTAATGGAMDSAENALHKLRDIENVEVAFLMKEKGEEVYKISLRSKHRVDVSAVAKRFGGGGHIRAAGCTCHGPLNTVRQELLHAIAAEGGEL